VETVGSPTFWPPEGPGSSLSKSNGARRPGTSSNTVSNGMPQTVLRRVVHPVPAQRPASTSRFHVPLPRRDLPVFHTAFTADSVTAVVNGTGMPLADAVIGLLTGRIDFCDQVANGRPAIAQVSCFEYPCYRCGGVSLFWEVDREIIDGPCGTTAEIRHALIWAQDRPEAQPDVRRRVAVEADRLGVPLPNLGSRYSATARSSYTSGGQLYGRNLQRSHSSAAMPPADRGPGSGTVRCSSSRVV
jgi:hypothetical protein